MRLIFALLLALCAAPVLAQEGKAPPPNAADAKYPLIARAEVLANAVEKVIRPAFATFKAETADLNSAMGALCETPSAQAVATANAAFAKVVDGYSRVEFFKIGPITEQNRAERLLFWPDPKGIALKQVQQILSSQDAAATIVDGLRGKSVAVQGLGALEYVLFGTGSDTLAADAGHFRCHYGATVATAIAGIASDLDLDWQTRDGIATHLMEPREDYTDYRTKIEALEEIVGTLAHGIEAVRDTRLLPFIGRTGKAAPKQALFWRSGLTMAAVRANIEGLETLFKVSRIAQAVGPDHAGLENTTLFEFKNAYRGLGLVTSPVADALVDTRQLAALNYLVIVTQSLGSLFGDTLSAALSLSVGFSSLDGD
ncbi:imelysin family protein [Devosia sp.]|uniref:imelysin family protein n=1 Tax=Devosia sp. TaxID=1871048 RepID=UPI003267C8F9